MSFRRAMPVLQVADVPRAVAFYERLGFQGHGIWGDPPGFCIVQRGDVTLALDRSESPALPLNQWWAAYVYVTGVDALHAEFATAGLAPTDLCDQDYGCRDFDVVDPDGHRIAFGQTADDGLGPERGRG